MISVISGARHACSPGRDAPGSASSREAVSHTSTSLRWHTRGSRDARVVIRRLWWICGSHCLSHQISSVLARVTLSVLGRYIDAARWSRAAARTWRAGCRSAMHKRALSKDYDYFIALYARVVKFTCHFNNWLPAGAGPCSGRASGERWSRDRGEDARSARGPKVDGF